jgi:hypothetical protein
MSSDRLLTKEKLDAALRVLGQEFRKLNGTKTPAEIILIGGAAILVNYGFREMTYDVDAVIFASSAMKEAANRVGDRFGLPNGWLNMDFQNTASYSEKLSAISIYYKTFSNVLSVRTVAAEHLVAMKLMSGRRYRNDLSDIVGILWEHQKSGRPIGRDAIEKAIVTLYGQGAAIPAVAMQTLDNAFAVDDLGPVYREIREAETQSRDLLLDFDKTYPGELQSENVDAILEQARRRMRQGSDE